MRTADEPLTIAACIGLAIAGFVSFMGMPMLVGAVIDQYGFSEGQGGYVASAEYLGMLLASALVSLLILRVSRRLLALIGTLTAIASNAACLLVTAVPSFLAVRFASGLGCGIAYAVAVAVLAGSQQTVRNFMLLIFGQVLVNALIVYTLPMLIAHWQIAGVFACYCTLLLLSTLCVPLLPRQFGQRAAAVAASATGTDTAGARGPKVPGWIPWLCLLAVFCFYLMIGAYWAYIERIGLAVGFDQQFVGEIIAAGILFSLIACLVAYRLSERIGQSRPLLFALAVVAATHLWSGYALGQGAFLVGLAAVNCFWNFTDIYQLGTISAIDQTGVFAARVPGAQMLAMTVSPALAGVLLDAGLGYGPLLMLIGVYVALAFALYAAVYAGLKRRAPELARAA